MEDNDILVVHKHAGMAVQNARMGHIWLSFTGAISRLRACWCLRKTKTPQENWDGR